MSHIAWSNVHKLFCHSKPTSLLFSHYLMMAGRELTTESIIAVMKTYSTPAYCLFMWSRLSGHADGGYPKPHPQVDVCSWCPLLDNPFFTSTSWRGTLLIWGGSLYSPAQCLPTWRWTHTISFMFQVGCCLLVCFHGHYRLSRPLQALTANCG
jgi:hypothetical protein